MVDVLRPSPHRRDPAGTPTADRTGTPTGERTGPGSTPDFVRDLAAFGRRAALRLDLGPDGDGGVRTRVVTYAELDERVERAAAALGPTRRLVALTAGNDLDSVVAYLGALRGGHVVALASTPAALAATVDAFDPDVVVGSDGALDERHRGTAHDLHPDLCLLLSTSGTTGSPKLVRLSRRNVEHNAAAVARSLDLTPDDRAITTLPLGYCYGLSVLHSHLHVGASVVLNDLSVVDRCFWDRVRRHRATSFAGVPHTFDLLDRAGFADLHLPSLRTVTQAGGRLAPEQVRRYAELAAAGGWRLVVMYGQTEATARMACLPPELAATHPTSIGRPIPGGSFELEPIDGEAPADADGVGELVYRGPNVMMGYAERPADLAAGPSLDRLRTGDLARRTDDGLYEIVGRRSRFVKLFGLRIDLDHAERLVADAGHRASCCGDDGGLVVGVETGDANGSSEPDVERAVRRLLAERLGVPAGRITVVAFDVLPRLPSGKPDPGPVRAAAARPAPAPVAPASADDHPTAGARAAVADVFAEVLGVDDVRPDDTFLTLGGDSLSYVEVAHRLEEQRGPLPDGWQHLTVADLERTGPPPPPARRRARVETTVVIRAASILTIVATHVGVVSMEGGGHLLLVIAGMNAARFWFDAPDGGRRLGGDAARIARIALPTIAYLAAAAVLIGGIHPGTIALASTYVGTGEWRFRYWFVEALVQIMVVLALLRSVEGLRRGERRAPFAVAAGALAVTLALRELPIGDPAYAELRTHTVAWLFALGWLIQRADSTGRRVLVTAVAVATVIGSFHDLSRELVILAGVVVAIWWTHLPVPRLAQRAVVVTAGASFAIYLTHWQAVELLRDRVPAPVTIVAAIAAGIAVWTVATRASRRVHRAARDRRAAVTAPVGQDQTRAAVASASSRGRTTVPTSTRSPWRRRTRTVRPEAIRSS